MDEDVRRIEPTGEKAEAAQAVEPLHDSRFPVALRHHDNVRSLRKLRWMYRRGIVHGQNAKCLQSLWPAQDFADYARTLVSGLKPVSPEAGYVQQYVGKIFVWNNKAITFGRVEPLNRPRYFKDVNCGFFVALGKAL